MLACRYGSEFLPQIKSPFGYIETRVRVRNLFAGFPETLTCCSGLFQLLTSKRSFSHREDCTSSSRMGSSNSRHVSQSTPERRDRGEYPAATRRESQARGPSGQKYRPRFCTGRFSSSRRNGGSSSSSSLDPSPSAFGRRAGIVLPKEPIATANGEESSVLREERPGAAVDQHEQSWATGSSAASGTEATTSSCSNSSSSSSSSTSFSEPNTPPIPDSVRTVDSLRSSSDSSRELDDGRSTMGPISRNLENGGPSVGLVMEIVPVAMVSPEAVATESQSSDFNCGDSRPSRSVGSAESRSSWFEGHSNWTSRLESAGSSGLDSSSSGSGSAGLSQYRQSSPAVCETSNPQRRNEMQELIRRSSGFGPAVNIRDLERGILRAREPSGAQSQRTGNASSSMSGNDRDDFTFQTTPASLQAWEITEEGAVIEYRQFSDSSWERHLAFHPSESQSSNSDNSSSTPPGSSSNSTPLSSAAGRESRRNGGRRLWDTLTRAASHRRTATPMTAPLEASVESWSQPDDHMDILSLHSRSRDLEERRRRVRSQVWALQLLNNGLDGFSRPCTAGGHHHGHCSCDVHSSAEESSTRASIYRIMMLAEALFEVLDEIHRQSVALSRTSAPIASLPAPDNVVDAIPIRKFSKTLWDEATQCNICLNEYEDGDQVRVLPCHHEYHMACVDKWLKEVHRVCPLCRGNVCETNSGGAEHSPVPS